MAKWLRSCKEDRTVFLLAIHRFEELFTFTEEAADGTAARDEDRRVDLIHGTPLRNEGPDAEGKPQPCWPTP